MSFCPQLETELKMLAESASSAIRDKRYDEVMIRDGFIKVISTLTSDCEQSHAYHY